MGFTFSTCNRPLCAELLLRGRRRIRRKREREKKREREREGGGLKEMERKAREDSVSYLCLRCAKV